MARCVLVLAWLAVLVSTQNPPGFFINPPPVGDNRVFTGDNLYSIGSQLKVQWQTQLDSYSVVLWQQNLDIYFADPGDEIFSKDAGSQEPGGFTWTVTNQNFYLNQSNVFFLTLGQNTTTVIGDVVCHYFNLTDSSESLPSTSPISTILPITSPTSTNPTSTNPSSTSPARTSSANTSATAAITNTPVSSETATTAAPVSSQTAKTATSVFSETVTRSATATGSEPSTTNTYTLTSSSYTSTAATDSTPLMTSTSTPSSSSSTSAAAAATTSPSTNDSTPHSSSSLSSAAKVGLGVGIGVGVPFILAVAFLAVFFARRASRKNKQPPRYTDGRPSPVEKNPTSTSELDPRSAVASIAPRYSAINSGQGLGESQNPDRYQLDSGHLNELSGTNERRY